MFVGVLPDGWVPNPKGRNCTIKNKALLSKKKSCVCGFVVFGWENECTKWNGLDEDFLSMKMIANGSADMECVMLYVKCLWEKPLTAMS